VTPFAIISVAIMMVTIVENVLLVVHLTSSAMEFVIQNVSMPLVHLIIEIAFRKHLLPEDF